MLASTLPRPPPPPLRAALGFRTRTEPWEVAELGTGHYVHLNTRRASPRGRRLDFGGGRPRLRPRIVFLHGLGQSLEIWRATAVALHAGPLGAECVLVDLVGHGKTSVPGGLAARCRPDVMCRQLQRVLEEVGWMSSSSSLPLQPSPRQKIILAGLSMGGAISLLWAEQHMDCVERIVRVAAAGLEESWWQSAVPGVTWMGRLLGAQSVLSGLSAALPACQLLAQLHAGLGAPSYGCSQNMPELLLSCGVPVSVVSGTLDQVHRPHLSRWKPSAVLLKTGWEHVAMCNFLNTLELHAREDLWFGGASPPRQAYRPRSKL